MKRWIVFVNDEIKLCVNPLCTLLMSPGERVKVSPDEINFNAPELLENGKISLKYDIWSLGMLLWHMCTLENPFDYLLETGNFSKLALPIQYSMGLRLLFKNMTELKPDKRPSAAEILEDNLFYKFKYHLNKFSLRENRYKLATITERDTITIRTKFPLQAIDFNDKKKM
jgi:serine/threonine protein kinase